MTRQGATKTPKAKNTEAVYIQAPAFPKLRSGALASRHRSPRWTAPQDAQRWDRRRVEQWQQLGPLFLFQRPKFLGLAPNRRERVAVASEAFRGEFYQKVDAKARVSIPAAFRRILEAEDPSSPEFPRPRVYMVYGGAKRNFVECYSKVGADALAARIEAMELGSPDRDRAERDLISRSAMVEIEPDGRVVLPLKVRVKMGFAEMEGGGEAAFAGYTNRFKLYRREVYDAEFGDEDDDGVDPLALVGRAARAG